MGLTGNDNVMVEIRNENGDCVKEETIAFDGTSGTITVWNHIR